MESSKENLSKAERKALKAQRRSEKELIRNLDAPQEKVNILCVRFGNKYGIEYVERLRNMISRNITVDYEFHCLTDSNINLSGVNNIVQRNAGYPKGWWHKVHMFDPGLPLTGRILYFDLDVIVHNNISIGNSILAGKISTVQCWHGIMELYLISIPSSERIQDRRSAFMETKIGYSAVPEIG
jgi:hypothetical protein